MATQPVTAPVSQTYGANCAYYSQFGLKLRNGSSCHEGTDWAAPCGTPVRAAHSGVVRFTGVMGAYGNYVGIQAPNGSGTGYAHLSEINVSVGQNVTEGQQIGKVGSTGNSTGCHLHFNYFRQYGSWVYDDPAELLKGSGMGIPQEVYDRDIKGVVANWKNATNKALRFLAASEYRAGGLPVPKTLDKYNDRDPDAIVKEIRALPGYSANRSDAQKKLDELRKLLEA